jgi:hypothetical protein
MKTLLAITALAVLCLSAQGQTNAASTNAPTLITTTGYIYMEDARGGWYRNAGASTNRIVTTTVVKRSVETFASTSSTNTVSRTNDVVVSRQGKEQHMVWVDTTNSP